MTGSPPGISTGAGKRRARELSIDEGVIAEIGRCDDYYLICTGEVGWDDGSVLDTYFEPWRIEEPFRVATAAPTNPWHLGEL